MRDVWTEVSKIRRIFISLIVLMIMLLLSLSTSLSLQNNQGPVEFRLLNLRDLNQAFSEKGFKLLTKEDKVLDKLVLNGIEPNEYQIQNTEDRVFFYIFNSIEERKKVQNSNLNISGYSSLFTSYSQFPLFFVAKNVLIVYCPKEYLLTSYDVIHRSQKIRELVFSTLEKGHTLVFRGKGKEWEAQVIFQYSIEQWKDAEGKYHFGNWHQQQTLARFRGNNPTEVGPIEYKITGTHSVGTGTIERLNQYGIARLGGGGGNGAISTIKDIYTFTIRWKGKEETFEMRGHTDPFMSIMSSSL